MLPCIVMDFVLFPGWSSSRSTCFIVLTLLAIVPIVYGKNDGTLTTEYFGFDKPIAVRSESIMCLYLLIVNLWCAMILALWRSCSHPLFSILPSWNIISTIFYYRPTLQLEINTRRKVAWFIKHGTKLIYFCSCLNEFFKKCLLERGTVL